VVPYADPAVVIVIIAAIVKEPLRSLVENFRQVLKVAPEPAVQEQVRTRIEQCLEGFEYRCLSVRMVEIGRYFYALIHVVLPKDSTDHDVDRFDHLRLEMEAAMDGLSGQPELDVVFTRSDRHALAADGTD
jgi:predicted Co/Zn/Cd cation transporter (cation efflux family)